MQLAAKGTGYFYLRVVSCLGFHVGKSPGTLRIDQPIFDHEVTTLRTCVNRQQPFGPEAWQVTIAATFALESALRRRERPRNLPEK